ncbi:MAG TPA: hypothetical protein VLK30_13395 [Candidatus Limnocylindrales bacterium]|nr:hypothetical protein [Candidatus Limnocylindrales bacterium]
MLTVVAASRNDGHGQNLVPRMQAFVDGLADQVERLGGEVELILVDWNPPAGRPSLSDVLTAPQVDGFTVRVVSVPAEVHARLSGAGSLSFFQMIAKNVGIRRAGGDAVLATNIDILLSDDLYRASTQHLQERTVYRADRYDIAFDPSVTTDPQQLRRSEPIRVNKKTGIYYSDAGEAQRYVRGGAALTKLALANPITFVERLLRPAPEGTSQLTRYRRAFTAIFLLPRLHLNACGDFTLMTRQAWEELRGYPEWEMFSWNLDSVLLYQAAAAGYAFNELPDPAFHLEHSSGFSLESQQALFERLNRDGIPVLTDPAALDVNRAIWKGRRRGRWRLNLDGWGMPKRELPEARLPVAGRPASRRA